MACGQSVPESQVHLLALSTTVVYEWLSPWIPCIGVDSVKAALRAHAVSGNFQVGLAIQTASVRTDSPDAPALLDNTTQVGEGEKCTGVVSIASTTAGKFFVRFGLGYSLSSGSTPGQADVSTSLVYTQCGQVLGSRSFALDTSTSSDGFALISGWVPALLAQKMKAVVICRSLTGNFEWKLAYRTATTSKENPSGWTALDANYHGAGELDSGEVSLSLDSEMWVQFGLQYHSTSGAGQAQVDCVVAIRRS